MFIDRFCKYAFIIYYVHAKMHVYVMYNFILNMRIGFYFILANSHYLVVAVKNVIVQH